MIDGNSITKKKKSFTKFVVISRDLKKMFSLVSQFQSFKYLILSENYFCLLDLKLTYETCLFISIYILLINV